MKILNEQSTAIDKFYIVSTKESGSMFVGVWATNKTEAKRIFKRNHKYETPFKNISANLADYAG